MKNKFEEFKKDYLINQFYVGKKEFKKYNFKTTDIDGYEIGEKFYDDIKLYSNKIMLYLNSENNDEIVFAYFKNYGKSSYVVFLKRIKLGDIVIPYIMYVNKLGIEPKYSYDIGEIIDIFGKNKYFNDVYKYYF